MFRDYVISKLSQSSAWIGLALVLGSFILPRTFILFIGILLILNDDAKLQSTFAKLRANLEKWWVK